MESCEFLNVSKLLGFLYFAIMGFFLLLLLFITSETCFAFISVPSTQKQYENFIVAHP